jgi:uncharacterized protein
MLGIDTNLLIYSLNPKSVWHRPAQQFLLNHLDKADQRVAICDYVLVELYVHLRNPAVMARPLEAKAARDLVTSYWQVPNVMRIENANVMDKVWAMVAQPGFARRRIFDLRLGLTLKQAGVTQFATANVKDFEGLGFEKTWNPLLT